MCCLRVVLWRPCCRRNIVLCPKWESDRGDLTNGQVVLPQRLRQTAFESHHIHTTTSHCGVQNTLSALQSCCYWTESKKPGEGNDILLLRSMWGKFPWNEPRLTFWAHCHKTPQKNKFILVVSDYFAKWTESSPIPGQEATTVTKKLVSNSINLFFWCSPCNFIATKEENWEDMHHSTDRLSIFMGPSLKCYMGGSCNTWDWDLQLPACMMTYRGAVHESTWVLSNLLMLGTWMS